MRTKLKIHSSHSLAQPDCARAKGNLKISLSADKKQLRRGSRNRRRLRSPSAASAAKPPPTQKALCVSASIYVIMLRSRRRVGRLRRWQFLAAPTAVGVGSSCWSDDARSAPPRSPFGSPPIVSSQTKNFLDFKLRATQSIAVAPTPFSLYTPPGGADPALNPVFLFWGPILNLFGAKFAESCRIREFVWVELFDSRSRVRASPAVKRCAPVFGAAEIKCLPI